MLTREFLQSPMAKPIFDALHASQLQAQNVAMQHIRNNTKSYDEARYQMGIADGIGRAINLLQELRKAPDS